MCSERIAAVALLLSALIRGQDLLSPKEALELAFPGAKVERTTVTLDDDQRARAGKLVNQEAMPTVVFPYVASKDGRLVGTAYFDTHRIRAQKETLMIVVAPDGTVQRVEVVGFGEPMQYLPKPAFHAQLTGGSLDGDKPVGKDVRAVAGATLTTQATLAAVRRVLAVHRVLQPAAAKPAEKKPTDGKAAGK